MEARVVEMWLRMTADAVRGADEAQKALKSLSRGPLSTEFLEEWMQAWMPAAASSGREEAREGARELGELVEEWWKAAGVVPRYQYLEVLERYQEVKAKLEEAEQTIGQLRRLLQERGHEEEAARVLDTWERVTREALRVQEEWARAWGDAARRKE